MRRTHRKFRNDPDGLRLPVKLDPTSNGEFAPIPLDAVHHLANETAMREATRHARGLGLSRREFLVSAAGTATALLAMNAAYAAAGSAGCFFAIRKRSSSTSAPRSSSRTFSSIRRPTAWCSRSSQARTRANP